MISYTYTRDGETFTIAESGLTIVAPDGTVTCRIECPLPHDVIAATVVSLACAGWVPVSD